MSQAMTSTQLLSQLKKWDIKYSEFKNWKTHNRNSKGPFGPDLHGLMVHHTGNSNIDQRSLLYDGYANLPGPLCHFGLAQNGVLHLIGWGRTNHAGLGDPDVLKAVINESYGNSPPTDNQATIDGNRHFYGVEIWHSGSKDMTDSQYFTLHKLGAAIIDFHGWSAKSVIAHGEWQPGKWDPGVNGKMANMFVIRSDIQSTADRGSIVTNTPVVKKAVYKDTFDADVAIPPRGRETKANPVWTQASIIRFAAEQAEQASKDAKQALANTNEILALLKKTS